MAAAKDVVVVHVDNADYFQTLLDYGRNHQVPVIIKFGAVWCGPCKAIAPKYHQLAAKYKDQAYFCDIDIDMLQQVAMDYEVASVPCFCVVTDGKIVDRWTGASPAVLEKKIAAHVDRSNQ